MCSFSVIIMAQIKLSLYVPNWAWNLCLWCSVWGRSGCNCKKHWCYSRKHCYVRSQCKRGLRSGWHKLEQGQRAWVMDFACAGGWGETFPLPKTAIQLLLWLSCRFFWNCSIRILRCLFLPKSQKNLKAIYFQKYSVIILLLSEHPPRPPSYPLAFRVKLWDSSNLRKFGMYVCFDWLGFAFPF